MNEVGHIVSFSFARSFMERHRAWVIAVFFFLCYYMLVPANFGFLNVLRESFYICVVPVLVAAVLYFRRFRDGTEFKLLFAFWIWFWFSRALNGSPTLDHDFEIFFDLSLMIPFFALGSALTKTERERFLDWLCALFGGFYFVIGLIALVAFFRHTMYVLPHTEARIGILQEAGRVRAIILDDNRNTTAFWYLAALYLMIYQFFHCENKLWRVPILLSAVLDLLVIAVLYSRSIWLCKALTFAMLAVMLLLGHMQSRPRLLRMSAAFAAAVFVLIASYEISGLCSEAMEGLSYKITDSQLFRSRAIPQDAGQEKTGWTEDNRSIYPIALSSGKTESPEAVRLVGNPERNDPPAESGDPNYVSFSRSQIWYGALQTIRANPSILWRGHLCDSVTTAAYRFIAVDGTGQIPWNFYNSFIQVLMTTGLPGLALVLFFLALVLYRALRFSLCVGAPLSIRTLVLPALAIMPYFMLEAGLFSAIDIKTLFYFLMCGIVIGSARDYRKGL